MTESEFWDALEQVFGPALGHSLASDLYLPPLKTTARDALKQGTKPDAVWVAVVEESGVDPSVRWIHRRPKRKGD